MEATYLHRSHIVILPIAQPRVRWECTTGYLVGKRLNVYTFVHISVSRLISYFRTKKDQFWLEEQELDENTYISCARFRARFTADGVKWHRWNPPSAGFIIAMHTCDDAWIGRDDWERAREFMNAKRGSPLARELLARAQADAWMGRRRSAIIDAVTALEVAINAFARSSKAHEAFGDLLALRMDGASHET